MPSRLKINDYKVISLIGQGGFGKCYKVQQIHTNEIFVWKAIHFAKMSKQDKERMVSEVNFLRELDHPNIVRYFGHLINKQICTLYIIMEYCEGGDLGSLIQKCNRQGTQLTESFVWHILYQTGRAIQACHSLLANKTVIHRDIKPANVFLDGKSNVKLGDFGLACTLDREASLTRSYVGTPYYMSPEVVFGEKYTRKSDVWSLGCLVFQMCSQTPPFKGTNFSQLALNIRAGNQPRIPLQYTDDLQNIISELLTVKHELRPSIDNIMQHPIVVSNIINNAFDSQARIGDQKVTSIIQMKPSVGLEERFDFQNELAFRLEGLKTRESLLREKELAIEERERVLQKREKEVALLGRLTKQTMTRANVYLNQCRDSRSLTSGVKNSAKRSSILEPTVSAHDTSLSADPGDTSVLPTSCKIKPSHITKPFKFEPSFERHVRFSIIPTAEKSKMAVYHQHLGGVNMNKVSTVKTDDSSSALQKMENVDAKKLDSGVADSGRNNVTAKIKPHSLERSKWLENKRQAYITLNAAQNGLEMNKENVIPQLKPARGSSINKITQPCSTQQQPSYSGSTGHFR